MKNNDELAEYGIHDVELTEDDLAALVGELGLGDADASDLVKGLTGGGSKSIPTVKVEDVDEKKAQEVEVVEETLKSEEKPEEALKPEEKSAEPVSFSKPEAETKSETAAETKDEKEDEKKEDASVTETVKDKDA